MPFFSVVIPTYNRAGTILRAVNSVIRQSFRDWELIVVDDGSTDETAIALSSVGNGERIILHSQSNAGRSSARNKGIELSSGKFVCFLDSDDEYHSDHLATLHECILSNNSKLAFYKTLGEIGNQGDFMSQVIPAYNETMNPLDYLLQNRFFVPSVCLPKEILNEYRFNPDLWLAEDSELFMRILSRFPLVQVGKVTVLVHMAGDNSDRNARIRAHKEYIRTFNRILSLEELKGKFDRKLLREIIRRRWQWLSAEYREGGIWDGFLLSRIKTLLCAV